MQQPMHYILNKLFSFGGQELGGRTKIHEVCRCRAESAGFGVTESILWCIEVHGGSFFPTWDIPWSRNALISYLCCATANTGEKINYSRDVLNMIKLLLIYIHWEWNQTGAKGGNRGVKPYVAHCLFKKTSICFAKYQSRGRRPVCVSFFFADVLMWLNL